MSLSFSSNAAEVYGLYSEYKLLGGFFLAFGDAMVWPKIADKSLFTRVDFSLRNSAERSDNFHQRAGIIMRENRPHIEPERR